VIGSRSLLGQFLKANVSGFEVINDGIYLEWTIGDIRLEWLIARMLNSQDGGSAWPPVQGGTSNFVNNPIGLF
jgi:hypothetical protein